MHQQHCYLARGSAPLLASSTAANMLGPYLGSLAAGGVGSSLPPVGALGPQRGRGGAARLQQHPLLGLRRRHAVHQRGQVRQHLGQLRPLLLVPLQLLHHVHVHARRLLLLRLLLGGPGERLWGAGGTRGRRVLRRLLLQRDLQPLVHSTLYAGGRVLQLQAHHGVKACGAGAGSVAAVGKCQTAL